MGIIYKIEVFDKCYIGSTIQELRKRQYRHNGNLRNNFPQPLYQYAIKNNINHLECILLEECDNEIVKERENDYIKNTENVLNERLSIGKGKNYYTKKYQKTEKGKKTKAKADKIYYEKNKDKLIQDKREYYEKNKEKWKTDEYRKKQKERSSKKVDCEICGLVLNKGSLVRHKKRKHQSN